MITTHWPKATAEALRPTADCVLAVPLPGGPARFLCHAAVLSLDSNHLATLASLSTEQADGTLPELRLQADALPPSCRELDEDAWSGFLSAVYRSSSDFQVMRRSGAARPGRPGGPSAGVWAICPLLQ